MIRLRHKLFIYALRMVDQLLLIGTLLIAIDTFGRIQGTGSLEYLTQNYYGLRAGAGMAALGFGWIWIFDSLVRYNTNRLKPLRAQLTDVFQACSAAAFLLFIVGTTFHLRRIHSELVLTFWVTTCALSMLGRYLIRQLLMSVRLSGYNHRHLIILGNTLEAHRIVAKIESAPELGYNLTGFVATGSEDEHTVAVYPNAKIMGRVGDIQRILEEGPVDEIMICVPLLKNFSTVSEVIQLGQQLGIVVRLFPDTATAKLLTRSSIEQFDDNYVVTFFRERLLLQLFGKRLMDIALSFALLVVLSPLLITTALAIKLTSPGPILFIQPRVGMNKRSFKLLKFRSMYIDAEKRRQELAHLNEMDGPVFKIRNDPRVTPIGRFIRKWSIDELPQLVNVLTGQISLVGPRPPLLDEVNRYEWLYRKRLSIKPGVTCLWQISGRNNITFQKWMELDQHYIDNWSIWLDIKILAKTIPAVLLRRGAS
jgi:exopolysaccharide biosynthesis polyprenyl glycosylphosphotransferase